MEIKGLVSVIIPVYQAEKYLTSCVEKILGQTYQNIEILLVNDGSTDRTEKLCEKLSGQYYNIQAYHQENLGCGQARARGLQEASGEYIVFVDVDDELFTRETIATMKHAMEMSSGDILVGNYCRRIHGDMIPAARHGFDEETMTDTRDFRFQGFFSGGVMAYTWGKMYRSEFLREHELSFADVNYAEDKLFNIQCYLNEPHYIFIEEDVYVYTQNPTSVSFRYKPDFFDIWMKIAKQCEAATMKQPNADAYMDFTAYIIFFAVFFQAKQEYVYYDGSMMMVRKTLRQYRMDAMAGQYLCDMARGHYITGVRSGFWKLMMRGFSMSLRWKWYGLLTFGIKLLIDWKIDSRLSSTGHSKNHPQEKQ